MPGTAQGKENRSGQEWHWLCHKRLGTDFLISGNLPEELEVRDGIKIRFIEEMVPGGKASKVKLFSLEEQE